MPLPQNAKAQAILFFIPQEKIIMESTDKASDLTHEALDKIAGATRQTVDTLGEKGGQLKIAQRQWLENCRNYIRDQPLMSLGIAAAAGFLLSGSWLELVSVAVLMLVENGVTASSAILFAVAFNLLIALTLWGVIHLKNRET
jgi:ElaB/YqjD/DUF883 family membrane-anchored ribosome-binding protein